MREQADLRVEQARESRIKQEQEEQRQLEIEAHKLEEQRQLELKEE